MKLKDEAPKLKPYNAISIIKLLSEAIQYMHKNRVLHNDIKTDNVMVYEVNEHDLQPILIDFGKACTIEQADYRLIEEKRRKRYRERLRILHPKLLKASPNNLLLVTFSH